MSKKTERVTARSKPNGNAGSMLDDLENTLEQAISDVPNVGHHPDERKVVSEQLDSAQVKVDEAEKATKEAEADIRRRKGADK